MFLKLFIATTVAVPALCKNLPKGLIFGNATQIEQELKRNAQFEQEWKEGNYISDLNMASSMTNCDQECDQWCWATSATMCASAFGSSGSCNRNEEKVASHELGRQCDSRCSGGCDQTGSDSNIVDGIKFLSGHSYSSGGVLSQSQLDDALRHGPVVLLVKWNGGGGHAVTVSGGSGGMYRGHDPEGYPIDANYGGLTSYSPSYGGRGKWAMSVYTNSGPSPEPSPSPSPGPSPSPSPGPSPSGCTDTPQNWASSDGYSCSAFVSYQYCTPAGQEGPGWNHWQWGPITRYADRQGRSAFDACCGCGGGSRSIVV